MLVVFDILFLFENAKLRQRHETRKKRKKKLKGETGKMFPMPFSLISYVSFRGFEG